MLKARNVRRTFYLAAHDDQAIQVIREKYGLSTDSDCVRLAVRLVAESGVAQLVKKKGK